ncbi:MULTISPECIES: magnesium transporter [Vibrio]|uniref:Magnesium transporter MgtE n=1 Tax=Vibrio natriegens NBRC 15636 = ATCC 14048 = DSM 759 TaxID=1219067 RepID=A0AAN0Y7A1_VIBNA|nr:MULTISPECIES: magnesium transporter [Vibrio]AEX23911.1 magnesium transporter MgtE [Vibrio sp. EJY3]ALR17839.1 magnesium transporter MgtE [Vibrio natriegens NBRC 15636 = ATCC 14048 = DSM 759]ANQ15331.1 magnesium transporter MgtE [Vibrio natriegens NBRC 15636 = ATCC 14048 = DSM 759]ANQ28058.1 magnesium transporter MgtE [Vibrio natriegens]AXT73123.1 magnesium transporter [Vibrio sp. dhg]
MSKFQDLSILIQQIGQAEEADQVATLNASIEEGLDPGSIALILEAFTINDRVRLWRALPLELHIDVLTEMRADVRFSIINALSEVELKLTLAKLDNLSLIEWADSLPEEIINEALALIEKDELELYDQANAYEDEEIGRWADRKIVTLPFNITVGTAKQLMDRYSYDMPQQVYLINRNKQFRGTVNYFEILRSDSDVRLKSLSIEAVTVLDSKMSLPEAVEALEHSTLSALPVTDADQTLIGEVDWQFALSTQREIYEARLMAGTGMDEGDDLFAPVIKSSQKRGVWLGINLMTAILASVTIGLFEDVIAQVVALAVLMPIVASMGGIAGSQTLTLMVRAMALNQITPGNRFKLLKNELGIGSLNGIAWAVIIGGLAGLWFQSAILGGTIALAIVVNIITAAVFGVLIPIILDKLELDPALAGSVILTTVTDVVGFFAFLGTASLVLL